MRSLYLCLRDCWAHDSWARCSHTGEAKGRLTPTGQVILSVWFSSTSWCVLKSKDRHTLLMYTFTRIPYARNSPSPLFLYLLKTSQVICHLPKLYVCSYLKPLLFFHKVDDRYNTAAKLCPLKGFPRQCLLGPQEDYTVTIFHFPPCQYTLLTYLWVKLRLPPPSLNTSGCFIKK